MEGKTAQTHYLNGTDNFVSVTDFMNGLCRLYHVDTAAPQQVPELWATKVVTEQEYFHAMVSISKRAIKPSDDRNAWVASAFSTIH